MKYSMWMMTIMALTTSIGLAAIVVISRDRIKTDPEVTQVITSSTEQSQVLSNKANIWAEETRKEFADRLIELRDWELDLGKQTLELNQENSALQYKMEQNKLELELIKVDQKGVQRDIAELEREKEIFDIQDKLLKK